MTTRNPTPVPVPPLPPAPRPSAISPARVFTNIILRPSPIGQIDRAPAAVPPGPGTGQSTGTTTPSIVPVINPPVDITPSENNANAGGTNITVPQPIYISVMDEGTTVTRSTTVLNFIGSGVSVTGTSSQANITIASGGNPGGSNTQVQFNNSGLFGGSANLTFNNSTQTLGIGGNVSATGNIVGSYFVGDGSQLTGLPASYANANVVTLLANFGSNTILTTGNVTSGNIVTGGVVSATGNIRGSNLNTAGIVSATGNITGSFFVGNGSQLTGIVSSYGNANVAANLAAFGSNPISTTGNVAAGNFIGSGVGTPTITSTTDLDLSAVSAVRVIGGGTFRLPTLTTAQIANLTAVNGDIVYNSTTSKIQAYAGNVWGNITLS